MLRDKQMTECFSSLSHK